MKIHGLVAGRWGEVSGDCGLPSSPWYVRSWLLQIGNIHHSVIQLFFCMGATAQTHLSHMPRGCHQMHGWIVTDAARTAPDNREWPVCARVRQPQEWMENTAASTLWLGPLLDFTFLNAPCSAACIWLSISPRAHELEFTVSTKHKKNLEADNTYYEIMY